MSALRTGRVLGIAVLAALAAGWWIGRASNDSTPAPAGREGHEGHAQEEAAEEIWTCSMHPQIRLPESGQCPICFMDLIPLDAGAVGDPDVPRLEMTAAARALAGIETAEVRRGRPFVEVRLGGKVDYDETRIGTITARTAGRLERLYVDFTGSRVRKGDHLAEIYSPEVLTAEQELVQALRSRDATGPGASERMRRTADDTVEAVQEKLRLLGLTKGQVDRIAAGRTASDQVTVYAPAGGIVIDKPVVEGAYVGVGTVLFRIADLSQLWVQLDAYERDLPWLRYGQQVDFTTEAYPGRTFRGSIVFLSPTLDARTRTSKVRVHVANEDGLLKPEMLVHGRVLAEVGPAGGVVAEDLAGKWVCPMHPEVVKDRRGRCDVCGMPLERAEDLGYATGSGEGEGPLLVPRSAVLLTGERAIVYVEDPDTENPTFHGRQVVLGPRAGDAYVVESGLEAGERVVVNGNFKIDSALQIQAKPSMMSPPDGVGAGASAEIARIDAPAAFVASLTPVYDGYFALSAALAGDDDVAARNAYGAIHHALHAVDDAGLPARGRRDWQRNADAIAKALEIAPDAGLEPMRARFEDASKAVLALEAAFGHAGDATWFLVHCPMAFDFRGARWMQDHEVVDNPYFGASMLRCGDVEQELAPAAGES